MFIRKTLTRRKGKADYATYRLVHNERLAGRVRQRTLLNLGAHFAVPSAQWSELVELVRSRLDDTPQLFEPPPQLEIEAERIVHQLQLRHESQETSDLATVHLNSLSHEPVRSCGAERLSLAALETLDFKHILRHSGLSERDARIALALVTARMVAPASERETLRWLTRDSATLELLQLEPGRPLSLSKLYRVCGQLWDRHEQLETALFARQQELFDLPGAIVFYDLTNVHFTGRPASHLARFGRSKQKRHDSPLVTLALSLDASGFPRRSLVLPGNVSEPGTLAGALDALEVQDVRDGDKPTVVMDAGLSTKENLAALRQRGYHWITVRRGGKAAPPPSEPDERFLTRAGHVAEVWRLESEAGEQHLCLWSEERQGKEDAMLLQARERIEEELDHLHTGLSKKGCLKNYEKVLERLGRLRERHQRVNRQYDIKVVKGEHGRAAAVHWKRNDQYAQKEAASGHYRLRTSHVDWDLPSVVRTYWRLTELEATFRSLKSELGLRPIWHQTSRQICAHLFIAVLAYHGVHWLRQRLSAGGRHDSWASLRRQLSGWVRVQSSLRTAEGHWVMNWQDSRPGREMREVASAVGVEVRPWRRRAIRGESTV